MRPEETAALLAPDGDGVPPDLARVRLLLERLGCPEPELPTLPVGGTNGKGSVVALLEAAFSAGGVRVGALTSPEPDGVRISGAPLGAGELWSAVAAAVHPLDGFLAGPGRPTLPEAVTAAALSRFAREGVELALVEVSQGGRRDVAAALGRPLLSLITVVEEDRRGRFGPGVGQAAWEEAGLARQGVPLLTVERKEEVLATFAHHCREVGAALVLVDPGDMEPLELTWKRAVWRSRRDPLGLGAFESGLLGAYQGANLALALGALTELAGGLPLSRDAVREGFASARCPGRFEVLSTRPYLVLDRAQNPAGARALLASLDRLPSPRGRKLLLFGAQRGRLVREIAEVLFPRFDRVMLFSSGSPEEIPPRALAHQARRLGVACSTEVEPREVVGRLDEDDLLVVCGPGGVVQGVRGVLGSLA